MSGECGLILYGEGIVGVDGDCGAAAQDTGDISIGDFAVASGGGNSAEHERSFSSFEPDPTSTRAAGREVGDSDVVFSHDSESDLGERVRRFVVNDDGVTGLHQNGGLDDADCGREVAQDEKCAERCEEPSPGLRESGGIAGFPIKLPEEPESETSQDETDDNIDQSKKHQPMPAGDDPEQKNSAAKQQRNERGQEQGAVNPNDLKKFIHRIYFRNTDLEIAADFHIT